MEIRGATSAAVQRTAVTPAQASAAVTVSSEPASTDSGSPQAPSKISAAGQYISPVLRYDQTAELAVILFRDSDTGETRDQIPPKRVVEEYRRKGGRSLADSPGNTEIGTPASGSPSVSAGGVGTGTGASPTGSATASGTATSGTAGVAYTNGSAAALSPGGTSPAASTGATGSTGTGTQVSFTV